MTKNLAVDAMLQLADLAPGLPQARARIDRTLRNLSSADRESLLLEDLKEGFASFPELGPALMAVFEGQLELASTEERYVLLADAAAMLGLLSEYRGEQGKQ